MEANGTTADARARITKLPGPSRLVRISELAWTWVRARSVGAEPPVELPEEQILELEAVGILVEDPVDDGSLVLERHWTQFVRAGLETPVGIELVCVDGAEAWTTSVRIAGRFVLVIDQLREVESDTESVRLGRRSSGVILGVTTIEHLSATFECLLPQRRAFTDVEPVQAPIDLADSPAVAEAQMLVISSPTDKDTVVSGGSWYACGERGEQLAVLTPGADGAQARELEPGSLTSAMRAKVIAALNHVTAVTSAQGSVAG